MADENRWSDRDRDWRDDRSWQEGRDRGRRSFYGGGESERYASQSEGRWRQAQRDRRLEGPAGYNAGGPSQGGWQFGEEEQGGARGQGYERYGYGRNESRNYDEYGRDPGYGREYGRGGGYGAGAQSGQYAGQGGYGISAQGEYGGYSTGQSRYAYGAHTPYGYRGRNEYDERGRGGEYADDARPEGRSWLERAGEKVSAFFGAEDEGRYRGRGPKGYRRSDDRIREDVSDRLTDDPWLDASDIEVEVRECEVVLKGAVHSREDKRRAEHLSEAISGVRNVQNHLRVEDGYAQTTAQQTAGRTTASASAPDKDPKGERRLQSPDSAPGLNT
jgi:osmotically-inducible protein OsmY